MRTGLVCAAVVLATIFVALLTGCGTPGTPLPPSLNLPDPVTDLSALRTGSQVSLTWTMPRRNTDKLPLKANLAVSICRREEAGSGIVDCVSVGELQLAPGLDGSFTETLPAKLAIGSPRPLNYYVELKNHKGRSAGLSNAATVLAGQGPAPVTALAAEVRKAGIVLRWAPGNSGDTVRLRRTLLTPSAAKPPTGPLPQAPEPIEQNLIVEVKSPAAGPQVLDKNITFGNTYEYRAQRLIRETVKGETIELDGELSAPIRVEAADVFPPAVPVGLAAVATALDTASGLQAAVDLSWQPNTDADLAGYKVYRREDATPWERISGDQPVAGPAFHDTHVVPGHTYRYGVSAVDKGGRESGRSEEAHEAVPSE
jgi:hypothetical protein